MTAKPTHTRLYYWLFVVVVIPFTRARVCLLYRRWVDIAPMCILEPYTSNFPSIVFYLILFFSSIEVDNLLYIGNMSGFIGWVFLSFTHTHIHSLYEYYTRSALITISYGSGHCTSRHRRFYRIHSNRSIHVLFIKSYLIDFTLIELESELIFFCFT